jgi:hypothetical protein
VYEYEVQIVEEEPGGFRGAVFARDGAGLSQHVGSTRLHGVKPRLVEEAKSIARAHRDAHSPEIVKLDLDED